MLGTFPTVMRATLAISEIGMKTALPDERAQKKDKPRGPTD